MDKDKEKYVNDLFARIAEDYDKLNDIMTGTLHKPWKRKTIELCQPCHDEAIVLDLCTGTGDMAYMWAENPKVSKVIGLDYCEPMLDQARNKLINSKEVIKDKVEFVQGDALKLPYDDNYFDAITVGFGLRNVKDLKGALSEIKRVLKPGANIASLDLGHPPFPPVAWFYKNVFCKFIPMLGAQFAKDKAAYQYLIDSLDTWPKQEKLSQMFWDLGYHRSYFIDISFGSIAIVVAEK